MNPRDFDPGPLADVQHRTEGGRSTLVFVRRFRHPPEKVWAALTDRKQLERWAPFDPDRDLGSAGPATLRMIDGEHAAEVRRAVAPELLEYTWGEDVLRWELVPDGAGTRLTLHHQVESKDWIPSVAAGWHLCLAVAERLLDGEPVPRIVGSQAMEYGWQELHDAYAARTGVPSTGRPDTAGA